MNYIIIFAGLVLGGAIGYAVRQYLGRQAVDSAEQKAQKIVSEAKTKEKEILLEAQQKSLNVIEEAKREEQRRRQELKEEQLRLEKRETLFEKQLLTIEERQQKLSEKSDEVDKLKAKLEELGVAGTAKLEKLSGLSRDEAKDQLFQKVENECRGDVLSRINKIQDEGSVEVEEKAKRVLANVIQRCAISHASDTMATMVDIPSDDMKGRIIGKEGRT